MEPQIPSALWESCWWLLYHPGRKLNIYFWETITHNISGLEMEVLAADRGTMFKTGGQSEHLYSEYWASPLWPLTASFLTWLPKCCHADFFSSIGKVKINFGGGWSRGETLIISREESKGYNVPQWNNVQSGSTTYDIDNS